VIVTTKTYPSGSKTLASRDENTGCSCILYPLYALTLGAVFFDYSLWVFFGKEVPFWADMLCGLFLASPATLTAIIGFILYMAGLPVPLFGG
jgi:hypothetical protein